MRAALVIARRILRQRLRDRSAIIFAVLTPLGLAVAFAAIIPDFSPTFHTTILVVDEDGGHLAARPARRRPRPARRAPGSPTSCRSPTRRPPPPRSTRTGPAPRSSSRPASPPPSTRGDPAEIRILAGGERHRPGGRPRGRGHRFAADDRGGPARGPDDRRERRPGRPGDRSRPRRPRSAAPAPIAVTDLAAGQAPGVDGHVLRRRDGDHVRLLRDPVRRARAPRRAARRDAQPAPRRARVRRRPSSSVARSRGWSSAWWR